MAVRCTERLLLAGWLFAAVALAPAASCGPSGGTVAPSPGLQESADGDTTYRDARLQMVERDLIARGVEDPQVLEAMRQVPRHLFVPEALRPHAYEDRPMARGMAFTQSIQFQVARAKSRAQIVNLNPDSKCRIFDFGTWEG